MKNLLTIALVVCSAMGYSQLVNLQYKGEFLAGTSPTAGNDFKGVTVLPTGHFLVWGDNGTKGLLLWFSRTGTLVRTVETPHQISDLDTSSDGSIYIATFESGTPLIPLLVKYSVDGSKIDETGHDTLYGATVNKVEVDPQGRVHHMMFYNYSDKSGFSIDRYSPTLVFQGGNSFTGLPIVSSAVMCTSPSSNAYVFAQTGSALTRLTIAFQSEIETNILPQSFQTFSVSDAKFDPISNSPVVSAYGTTSGQIQTVFARFPHSVTGTPSTLVFPGPNLGQRVIRSKSGKFHVYGAPHLFSNPIRTLIGRAETNTSGSILPIWWSSFTPPGNLVPITGDMTLDEFEESYVAASFVPTGMSKNYGLLTKVNSAGALRFNSSVEFPDGVSQMKGIAIHHSSGDICMVGQGQHPTLQEGIIAIFRQAPIAIADSFLTIKQNTVFVSPKTVTTNDRQWQGASISVTQPVSTGTLTLQQNGVFTYTPPNGYLGYATFKYRLTKPGLTPSPEALVTLRVIP